MASSYYLLKKSVLARIRELGSFKSCSEKLFVSLEGNCVKERAIISLTT
jgi:hypothetical protein